jgi:CheY-like chemotaxis protein
MEIVEPSSLSILVVCSFRASRDTCCSLLRECGYKVMRLLQAPFPAAALAWTFPEPVLTGAFFVLHSRTSRFFCANNCQVEAVSTSREALLELQERADKPDLLIKEHSKTSDANRLLLSMGRRGMLATIPVVGTQWVSPPQIR